MANISVMRIGPDVRWPSTRIVGMDEVAASGEAVEVDEAVVDLWIEREAEAWDT